MNVPANLVFDPRASFVTPAGLLIPRYRAPRLNGLPVGMGQGANPLAPVQSAVSILGSLISIGKSIASLVQGCGSTCIQATNIANQAGDLMLQNLQAYLEAPLPHTSANQAAAIANFNSLWSGLDSACSSPALSTAGANCIADRDQSACVYKTSPGGWQQDSSGAWSYVYPGANGSGSTCWNYFVGFYDPIANDPTVIQSAPTSTSTSGGLFGSSTFLLFLAAAGLLFLLTEGS